MSKDWKCDVCGGPHYGRATYIVGMENPAMESTLDPQYLVCCTQECARKAFPKLLPLYQAEAKEALERERFYTGLGC